jgi:O-antigen/teichoic acid export membrane protein
MGSMNPADVTLPPRLRIRSVRTNVLSGGVWRVWQALLQFAFTPVYIHLLGPAGYGLVGFNATLIMLLAFLDQAVSPVLTREFSRLSGQPDGAAEMRAVLFTLQAVSLATAIAVGAGIIITAPFIVHHALDPAGLAAPEAITAVRLIGLTIAGQWPAFLFGAGFIGLQRQDVLAGLRLVTMTVQTTGAALALLWIAPTPDVFFGWQAGVSLPFSAIYGYFLWRGMPTSPPGAARGAMRLAPVLRFGAGTLSIGLLAGLLSQADNLVVAKYTPLPLFACYSLAFTLAAQAFGLALAPIAAALLPYFTLLTGQNDEQRQVLEYHRWAQLVAVVTLPLAGVLIVFGRPLLQVWLGPASPVIGPMTEILPVIALGSLLNGFVMPCYLMQLAAGWTRLSVITNIVTVCLFIPAVLLSVRHFGMVAGAVCWVAVNLGYMFVQVPLAHRRILRGQFAGWLTRDVLLPSALAAGVFGAAWWLGAGAWPGLPGAAGAVGAAALAAGLLGVALPHPRRDAMRLGHRLSERFLRRG